jgi:hypothetical protein
LGFICFLHQWVGQQTHLEDLITWHKLHIQKLEPKPFVFNFLNCNADVSNSCILHPFTPLHSTHLPSWRKVMGTRIFIVSLQVTSLTVNLKT